MVLKQCFLTKNDCYKESTAMTPKGILVHSTGVRPDMALIIAV